MHIDAVFLRKVAHDVQERVLVRLAERHVDAEALGKPNFTGCIVETALKSLRLSCGSELTRQEMCIRDSM